MIQVPVSVDTPGLRRPGCGAPERNAARPASRPTKAVKRPVPLDGATGDNERPTTGVRRGPRWNPRSPPLAADTAPAGTSGSSSSHRSSETWRLRNRNRRPGGPLTSRVVRWDGRLARFSVCAGVRLLARLRPQGRSTGVETFSIRLPPNRACNVRSTRLSSDQVSRVQLIGMSPTLLPTS